MNSQNENELEGVVQTRARNGSTRALYSATYGDFLINDPGKVDWRSGQNIAMFTDNAGSKKYPAYYRIKRLFAIGK